MRHKLFCYSIFSLFIPFFFFSFSQKKHKMEVSTPAGWSNLTYASLAVMAGLGVSWLLFQKNKLPPHLQKIAGRFFFYPTLPISLPLYYARGDYWSTIEGQLYYGAIPLSLFGHPDKMKSMGITAVVNLCDEYAGPVSDYERIGIEQLYTPVVDHNSPDQEEIEKCISFIDRKLREGKKVLIHCKAGHGRRFESQ